MKAPAWTVGIALLPILLLSVVSVAPAAPAADLARGRYLVESVGMCADRHTQRDDKGEFVKGKWLKGAPTFVKPVMAMPVWAEKAPNIAGLPGWTDEQAIKFFMTSIAYNDLPARPPMPQFRFSQKDAAAVVAYFAPWLLPRAPQASPNRPRTVRPRLPV